MGAYLSAPVTETTSNDEDCHKMRYGASSMQGWRMTQEDAHCAIIDYDEDTQFFAVFDGHGGAEVAQYSAQHLHKFIKSRPDYKAGNLVKALEESFIEFDATLVQPQVLEQLKVLAGTSQFSDDDSEEEDETNMLIQEAFMPIEDVIASRYNGSAENKTDHPADSSETVDPAVAESCSSSSSGTSSGSKSSSSKAFLKSLPLLLRKELLKGDSRKNLPNSPYLRAKRLSSSTNEAGQSSSSSSNEPGQSSSSSGVQVSASSSSTTECVSDQSQKSNGEVNDTQVVSSVDSKSSEIPSSSHNSSDQQEVIQEKSISDSSSSQNQQPSVSLDSKVNDKSEKEIASGENETQVGSSVKEEITPYKGKGKQKKIVIVKPEEVKAKSEEDDDHVPLYADFLKECDQEDSDDDDDDDEEDFEAKDSSEDEDDDLDDEEDEDEEDSESEDEDDDDQVGFLQDRMFADKEEPGKDSGCTAVVALVRNNHLYVANAGDSRCVLSRDGKAIEMSLDHKPEDLIERTRIENAGGKVTADGRVNGGLNLSRAIGDHAYKENNKLQLRDQMISSLPDIKTIQLEPERDEFMVLACDGIWNSFSSQQVVDFVREKLKVTQKLSLICEDLFKSCLSPDTCGDGTGCDNMTCIIIKFENIGGKRKTASVDEVTVGEKEANGNAESESIMPDTKKVKTGDVEEKSNASDVMMNCSATTV